MTRSSQSGAVPIPPEKRKRDALRVARYAAQEFEQRQAGRAAAIRRAHENGASLREISAATGLPPMAVKRIVDGAAAA